MSGLYKVYENNQVHFQVGDNNNLFDWTYVGNVAYAHLVAADRLSDPPPATPLNDDEKVRVDEPPQLTAAEQSLIDYPLPSIDLTTGHHRIPTSKARPLGPYIHLPPNGEKISAAFVSDSPSDNPRPIARTRFYALSEAALTREKMRNPDVSPLQVAGQAFFITNGEPCYFWDMPRLVWHELDQVIPGRKKKGRIVMSRTIGLAAATGAEWYGWLIGKEPALTRYKITYSCVNRWHNIEKARRVLGYEPKVGMQEGVRRMVEWWISEYAAGTHTTTH